MSAIRGGNYSDEGCPIVSGLSTTRSTPPIRRRVFMHRSVLAVVISVFLLTQTGSSLAETPSAIVAVPVDLTHRELPRLQPGIVVTQPQDFGYSDVVTIVYPRFASGAIDSLPDYAKRYASMFHMTILANVVGHPVQDQTAFLLDKIGIGFAMEINNKLTIVTKDSANALGASLGMIDRTVLSGNEDCLVDVVQIARTDRLIVFDAKANLLIGDKHEPRILRHFVWASPASGKLGILIWQLKENGPGPHAIDSAHMQLLPAGFKEDRKIHVSAGNFLSSKIPTPDRFALESLPQGTPVPFSERMKQVAGKSKMTASDLESLLAGASESLALMSPTSVARKP